MLPSFDSFVIETYDQLAMVVLALAVISTLALGLVIGRRRATARHATKPARTHALAAASAALAADPNGRRQAAQQKAFDTLSTLITNATHSAEHISETQSAAALQLDTAEIAVNRLLDDIGGIMPATQRTQPPATLAPAATSRPLAIASPVPATSGAASRRAEIAA